MTKYFGILTLISIVFLHCNASHSSKASSPQIEGVFITEFMASNDSLKLGLLQKKHDWIELYNGSSSAVDLSKLYLSDNKSKPLKSRLNGVLQPDSFAVFLASGKDSLASHLAFKLSDSGGIISLSAEDKSAIDEVKYDRQPKNLVSLRTEEGWRFSKDFSPGKSSSESKVFSAFSNEVTVNYTLEEGQILASFDSEHTDEFKYKILEKDKLNAKYKAYSKPFALTPGQVIKVKAVADDIYDHKAHLSSYVPENSHELPVVSLTTDPKNLWDEETGLYTQENCGKRGENWIRKGFVTCHLDSGFRNEPIEFKIFGNASRSKPKKSISFKSATSLENSFFKRNPNDQIDGFIARACHTGMALFRNEFMNDLNEYVDGHMRMQEYVPSVVYLNGEYWGVYNITERKNDEFIKNHTGFAATEMATLNDSQIKPVKGSYKDLENVLYLLVATDDGDEIYKIFEASFIPNEFIDFWAHELIINRVDTYNNRFWRSTHAEDKRWGIITFDYDIIFGKATASKLFDKYFYDEPSQGLKFFNVLMKSDEFKNKLVYRICELLNYGYTEKVITDLGSSYFDKTQNEFQLDTAKWNAINEKSFFRPSKSVYINFNKFSVKRKAYMLDSVFSQIGFTEQVVLTIPEDFPGRVYMNGFEVSEEVIFFTEMEFDFEVKMNEGALFKGWNDGKNTINLDDAMPFSRAATLTPVYELSN